MCKSLIAPPGLLFLRNILGYTVGRTTAEMSGGGICLSDGSWSTITCLIMLVIPLTLKGVAMFEERKMPTKLILIYNSISSIPFHKYLLSLRSVRALAGFWGCTEQVMHRNHNLIHKNYNGEILVMT